jgi:hypothetical protein
MGPTTNAAARLHAIFVRYASFREGADTGSIMEVWRKTFEVSAYDEVRALLMQVVGLIGQVDRQLLGLEKPAFTKSYADVAPVLLSCVVLPDAGTSLQLGSEHAKVYSEQLNTLELLATVLSDTNASSVAPTEEERIDFREQITGALEAVRDDQTLHPRIRQEVISRLHQILWALDHLDTVGPEQVIAAAEGIGFLWAYLPTEAQQSSGFQKAQTVAVTLLGAFLGTAETIQALETFQQVLTQH